MTVPVVKIDFVSDVSCPWCAIGLAALEQAIARVGARVKTQLHFQPFELNPDMAPGGERIDEHLQRKYGGTREQFARNQEAIRQRGAQLGFTFDMDKRSHIYNTFDAHRLLHWAELEGEPQQQAALQRVLFKAYFTDGENPESHAVLLRAASAAGLDEARARQVLESGEYAGDVRERERMYQDAGIHSVPAIVFNDRHLISGGQPVEVFERALRELAAQPV